jgi:hypothetical protein
VPHAPFGRTHNGEKEKGRHAPGFDGNRQGSMGHEAIVRLQAADMSMVDYSHPPIRTVEPEAKK